MERKGDGWVGEKKKASKSVAGALLVSGLFREEGRASRVTCHFPSLCKDPTLTLRSCLSTRESTQILMIVWISSMFCQLFEFVNSIQLLCHGFLLKRHEVRRSKLRRLSQRSPRGIWALVQSHVDEQLEAEPFQSLPRRKLNSCLWKLNPCGKRSMSMD
jgi:hypothetical protein